MKTSKAILHFLLFVITTTIVSLWLLLLPEDYLLESFPFLEVIIDVLQFIFVLIFIIIIGRENIYLKKTSFKYYFIAIFSGISFVYFQYILEIIYYFDIPKSSFNLEYNFLKLKKISVLSSILIIPITEELFFRYYLQGNLQKTKNIKYAILISTVLFSIIHIPFIALFYDFMEFSLHHAYIVFFGSIISGILFYKSKSIVPSIIFHAFWNLTVYVSI